MSVFRELAESAKARMAARLRQGRGPNGRLKPKQRPDGEPLGGRLPNVLRQGRVELHDEGFDVVYGSRALERFNNGNPQRGHPPRPVVGLTRADEREFRDAVIDDLRADAKRLGVAR